MITAEMSSRVCIYMIETGKMPYNLDLSDHVHDQIGEATSLLQRIYICLYFNIILFVFRVIREKLLCKF